MTQQVITLRKAQLSIRERLKKRYGHLQPLQLEDLASAYHTALSLAKPFSEMVKAFTQTCNQPDLEWQCRPGDGVKNPARILEKAFNEEVPLDFLGGKIIALTIKQIYEIAQEIPRYFEVCGFKDRFEVAQKSGYRDLQFQVKLKHGHIAELKVVHRAIDELDAIEHRIYEIVRMLAAKEMNTSESKVYEQLRDTSKNLYTDVWQSILSDEVRK